MQTALPFGAMSLFDAQALSDHELARIAQDTGCAVASVNAAAEHVRAHAAYDEQVRALVFTTGRPKEDVERLVRMVRPAVEQRSLQGGGAHAPRHALTRSATRPVSAGSAPLDHLHTRAGCGLF